MLVKHLFSYGIKKRCYTYQSPRTYTTGLITPRMRLLSGVEMPQLGLGTWKSDQSEASLAVEHALTVGYRHIDCAPVYQNEREVGLGLKNGLEKNGLKRDEIFLTSKLWNTEHHPDRVRTACEQTLHKNLGCEYLDLYLIHWPVSQMPEGEVKLAGDPAVEETPLWETFEAMNELISEGLVRSIGVSNFNQNQIEELISDTGLTPCVNQIEVHPYLCQKELRQFCHEKDIVVTAYSPLGRASKPKIAGMPSLLENSFICELAQKYNKSPAQICIRWGIQNDTIVIPKSVHPSWISENINVFDFEISKSDMMDIDRLDVKCRFVEPSFYSFK